MINDVGSLEFFTNGSVHVNEEFPNCIVMQSTGLKDKNGKEIYEGDILKPVGGSFKESNRSVEFVDGSFCYSLAEGRRGPGFSQLGQPQAKLFEVIGNIWENPDLLPDPSSSLR